MAIALKTEVITSADNLRRLLSQSEDRLVNLSTPASVVELYGWLDQIFDLLPEIQASRADLRAEETRWQSLQERLDARGARVLRAWQGGDRLAAARQVAQPGEDRWWWWIDRRVAERRKRKALRTAGIAVVVVAAAVLAAFIFQRLVPVDPVARESYRLQLKAETELAHGDLAAAYESLRQAVAINPDDPSLLILHGAAASRQGDMAVAEQSWQQARLLLNGAEAAFLTERALAFLRVQQPDIAMDDAQDAIAIDPTSARAYLVLGSTWEEAGQPQEAIAAYEQAAALAQEAGNSELVAIARVQIAGLVQRLQAAPVTTRQP